MRLSLPELVRGSVRGGTSSTTQFMPVIARTRSRIVVAQPAALVVVGGAALDEHRRRFLAARRGDREGGDVAGLEAGQLLDRPFDVLRPVVLAVDDDHVLGAADDVDVAVGHVAHVAGVEPAVDVRQASVASWSRK